MKAPILAVRAAIQHVPDFATHVPSCVDFSIASSSAKSGLTKEEVAAIKTYTAECPVYKLLNTALRSEQRKNIEPWFPYLKLLHIAISKLHPKKGTYCRGIGGNLSSVYPVGSTVVWIIEIFLILAVSTITSETTTTTSTTKISSKVTTSKPTTTTTTTPTTTSKSTTKSKVTTTSKPTTTSKATTTSKSKMTSKVTTKSITAKASKLTTILKPSSTLASAGLEKSWTLKNQISVLVIDISANGQRTSTEDVNVLLFIHILTMFPNLRYLNFGPSSIWYQQLSYDAQLSTIISSSLLELHVCLPDLIDCLYLLDGCFNQLRTLHVNITFTMSSNSTINNKEKLPNLRFFSLRSDWDTDCYDKLIVPLLNRMLNLEELNLFLQVTGRQKFVDSEDLKKNIIDHMSRLNKFKFSICSTIQLDNELDFPSNENIQKTFRDFKANQIISYVDYFPKARQGQCHIYSYPYKSKNYYKITNSFPGGLFEFVRDISLYDERPFEHEFFLRISRSFPYMEKLTLINRKQQNNKQCRKSKNQNFSIITYPHLIQLDLHKTHKDYHRQFLFDITTCLPDNVRVCMDYRLTKKVTHNFRRNITRNNCSKLSYVFFYYKSEFPEHLKDYFPRARIP
ncbi:unnamed protein product [Rotaria sp. Silwood2]|nr:unnamed protein product [Rotaria sp. Silwood2]